MPGSNLTPAMIEAACLFAQAHPRQEHPLKPAWRATRPLTTEVVRKRSA